MSRHYEARQGICPVTRKTLPPLALFFGTALLPEGWRQNVRLVISDGCISEVTPDSAPSNKDEIYGIGLPGISNIHSHAFQRGLAGLAEHRGGSDSFWTWRDVMYRFVTRLSPDEVEAISALAFAEMLEGGFTRVGEFHYLHKDRSGLEYAHPAEMSERIVAAASLADIGLTLLPVYYERGGFDGRAPNRAQQRFCSNPDEFGNLLEKSAQLVRQLEGGTIGIAPHSLRAVSPDSLRALLPLMVDRPTHIHVAEQRQEVEDCRSALGSRPVQWLLDNIPIGPQWCFVHAIHMDDRETEALAKAHAVACLCPISEANLGDGTFPMPEYLEHGGRFGIGTDANTLLSVPDELRILEYGQRLLLQSRNVIADDQRPSTGATLFAMAHEGGAQALGVTGGIQPDRPADIIALDHRHETLVGRQGDQILDALVFCGSAGFIDEVWRGGRRVVHRGRHIRKDAIVSRYRKTMRNLLSG